ncbi:MAG TPA: hypothetical protein VJH65_03405 [Candidatus Nanoarchaeia archaeon]|nr:hypothetical protein [Candidatus Nanoarchaeia archaeon]
MEFNKMAKTLLYIFSRFDGGRTISYKGYLNPQYVEGFRRYLENGEFYEVLIGEKEKIFVTGEEIISKLKNLDEIIGTIKGPIKNDGVFLED